MEKPDKNAETPLEEQRTSCKVEEVDLKENEKFMEAMEILPRISGPITVGILVHESQKQIFKGDSENFTVAILRRREAEARNQVAQKQNLAEDAKKENAAVKKKLAVLTENRKLVEEHVESDENITKQLMGYMQQLRGTSKGLIEGYKRFEKKNNKELQDKLLRVQKLIASIAANKKRREEIEKKKAVLKKVKDMNPVIQEKIKNVQKEIARIKNVSDAEAINIQDLKDKKLEIADTLLSKKEQATDLKNQISCEEEKLAIKKTLYLALGDKNAKLQQFDISKLEEKIALLRKQVEENSVTFNNNVITVQKLEGSIDVMKQNVETAKSSVENVIQKSSEDNKASKDRYEALEKDLMNLKTEFDEKRKVLQKSKENLIRLAENKNSLQTQRLQKQKSEKTNEWRQLHLESRQEYLKEISEARQKITRQQDEQLAQNTTTLLKINKEKERLTANTNYMIDIQKALNEKIERKKLKKAKLQAKDEMSDKNIAEVKQRVDNLKTRIQRGECVQAGILKRARPSTSDNLPQTSDTRTTAEKLFDELKKRHKK